MSTKKQLDRLFKEQFRNMDVTPPPMVWENIAAALQNKQKSKRVVPLWYKLAGVAAALLIFFGLGSVFYSPTSSTQITSDDSKTTLPIEVITPLETPIVDSDKLNDANNPVPNALVVEDNHEAHKDASSQENIASPKNQNNNIQQKEATHKSAFERVANATQNSTSNKKAQSDRSKLAVKASPEISEIAEVSSENKIKENKNSENFKPSETKPTPVDEVISVTETEQQTVLESENKKSLLDHLAEKNQEALTVSKPNPINRWEVAPQVAPVYYSSLGNGSSIDPQFSGNSKSGDVNLSYGVKVSYAINDKLSIRTGVSKVDLSYSTNDIEFAIASASDGLQSIDSKGKGYAVAVGPRGSLQPPASNLPTVTEDGTVIVPRNGIIPGTMQQELDYFEIPLELKYNLLNKRFGLNVVGGMSTLFLNNNQVSVSSDGFQTEIGSANNLNSVSFSTNVGIGFDYKLSNRFVFNLEPMFKYQLNPYSDSSIDFKPYYLGVYSGFSYRF